jgi:hypothetical protein
LHVFITWVSVVTFLLVIRNHSLFSIKAWISHFPSTSLKCMGISLLDYITVYLQVCYSTWLHHSACASEISSIIRRIQNHRLVIAIDPLNLSLTGISRPEFETPCVNKGGSFDFNKSFRFLRYVCPFYDSTTKELSQ